MAAQDVSAKKNEEKQLVSFLKKQNIKEIQTNPPPTSKN
jgi:hypothetical protein